MIDKIHALGIDLKGRKGVEVKTVCPFCPSGRGNPNDLSLAVNTVSGAYFCHYCNASGCADTNSQNKPLDKPFRAIKAKSTTPYKETVLEEVSSGVIEFMKKRGISEEVLRREQIKVAEKWFPQTNDAHKCIAFPFFKGNKRVATKYRDHNKNMSQDAGGEKCFYRFDEMSKGNRIYITEGEIDALTLVECGYSDGVVSVPDGAPNPSANNLDNKFSYFTEEAMNIFDDAEEIYLVVDNDANGRFLEQELKRRIGIDKCLLVDYPQGCKDINDVLLKLGHEGVVEVIENAQHCPVDGLKTFDDYALEIDNMRLGITDEYYETGYPDFDRHLKIKRGQLNIVTGSPGSGKSEFVDDLMINMIKTYGVRWAVFSPENYPPQVYYKKLAEKYNNKSFPEMNENEINLSRSDLSGSVKLIIDNDTDEVTVDYLLERIRVLVFRFGVRAVIIDPWNEIDHNIGSREDLYLNKILRKIKRFIRKYDVSLWLVAHPKNPKMLADGTYPRVTAYDIAGGYAWFAKADNVFSVWRDKENPNEPVEVNIQKIKQKTDGELGICYFDYDKRTGRYKSVGSSLDPHPICEDRGGVNVNGIKPI